MAVNSSSSSNDSLHPSDMTCLFTGPTSLILTSFFITNILLLLPLCILVLYLGLKRWQQQRSTSTATVTSHSDTFTYHMVAMELVGVLGCIICCYGINADDVTVLSVGIYLLSVKGYGESFFHILTFVKRYLAVVHPVTYLSLRRERGIRIRNITIGCVWLLCFLKIFTLSDDLLFVEFSLLILSLIIVTYCSISVLCVLIRPGPGDQSRDREQVDQSKPRAFYTIVVIMGVLLLKCFGNLVSVALNALQVSSVCVITIAEVWIDFPGSLVLPLLFLNRAGKLACCKNNAE